MPDACGVPLRGRHRRARETDEEGKARTSASRIRLRALFAWSRCVGRAASSGGREDPMRRSGERIDRDPRTVASVEASTDRDPRTVASIAATYRSGPEDRRVDRGNVSIRTRGPSRRSRQRIDRDPRTVASIAATYRSGPEDRRVDRGNVSIGTRGPSRRSRQRIDRDARTVASIAATYRSGPEDRRVDRTGWFIGSRAASRRLEGMQRSLHEDPCAGPGKASIAARGRPIRSRRCTRRFVGME